MSLDTLKLGGPYSCVFDVGSFRGDFARACRAAWPEATIHCFEPLEPMPSDDLGDTWWHAIALGPVSGKQEINECEFIPSSSFLTMTKRHKDAFPYTRNHTVREVEVRTLDEFGHLIRPNALLKIDVQGYELQVLVGGSRVLRLFRGVVCEVSWEKLYEGVPRFSALDRELNSFGLRHQRRIDELRDPVDKRLLLQSDELWLRS